MMIGTRLGLHLGLARVVSFTYVIFCSKSYVCISGRLYCIFELSPPMDIMRFVHIDSKVNEE